MVDLQAVPDGEGERIKIPLPELNTEPEALPLVDDPDTGMSVMKVVCEPGTARPGTLTPAPMECTSSRAPW